MYPLVITVRLFTLYLCAFESCLKDVINQTSEFESQREFEGEVAGEKLDILREIWRLERSRLTR